MGKHSLRCGKKPELVRGSWTFDEARAIGLLDIRAPLGVEEEPRKEWRGPRTRDRVYPRAGEREPRLVPAVIVLSLAEAGWAIMNRTGSERFVNGHW